MALTLTGPAGLAAPADAAVPAKSYPNCPALNKDYPHGVARKGGRDKVSGKARPVTNFVVNDRVYKLNPRRDGDGDGVACEKH